MTHRQLTILSKQVVIATKPIRNCGILSFLELLQFLNYNTPMHIDNYNKAKHNLSHKRIISKMIILVWLLCRVQIHDILHVFYKRIILILLIYLWRFWKWWFGIGLRESKRGKIFSHLLLGCI